MNIVYKYKLTYFTPTYVLVDINSSHSNFFRFILRTYVSSIINKALVPIPVFNRIVTLAKIALESSHSNRTNVGYFVWILQRNVSIKNECMDTKLVHTRLHVRKFDTFYTIRSIYFCDHNMARILENKKIGAIFNRQILDQFKVHVR